MPKIKANGLEFFYQRMGGDAPTVVFIHGLVIDNLSSWWYTLGNAAATQGADVVLYDLRGHGYSERPPDHYGTVEQLKDLLGILDQLGIDHPVHLVGNSYGGVISVAMAVAHPERVASLVLVEAHAAVETPERLERERLAHGLDLAGLLLTEEEVDVWLETVGGRKINRLATNARALIHDTTLIEDLRGSSHFTEEQLGAIACPVLLIYGERSDIFKHGADLAEHVPGAHFEIIPGMDHSVLMDSTVVVRRLILDWLARDWPGGTPGADG